MSNHSKGSEASIQWSQYFSTKRASPSENPQRRKRRDQRRLRVSENGDSIQQQWNWDWTNMLNGHKRDSKQRGGAVLQGSQWFTGWFMCVYYHTISIVLLFLVQSGIGQRLDITLLWCERQNNRWWIIAAKSTAIKHSIISVAANEIQVRCGMWCKPELWLTMPEEISLAHSSNTIRAARPLRKGHP